MWLKSDLGFYKKEKGEKRKRTVEYKEKEKVIRWG